MLELAQETRVIGGLCRFGIQKVFSMACLLMIIRRDNRLGRRFGEVGNYDPVGIFICAIELLFEGLESGELGRRP